MHDARPIAIGCMRLSTDPDRDDDRSVELLHAAFDAGVTLLDTADAYCLDERDIGHNERLIARALSTWPGDRSRITIATKGGMTRPDGRWELDGRAKHLRMACERSVARSASIASRSISCTRPIRARRYRRASRASGRTPGSVTKDL